MNIFSGADTEMGAWLTNPTELARKKGKLSKGYPIFYDGVKYPDVETAYQMLKKENPQGNSEMMVELIAIKLLSYPEKFRELEALGGRAFLCKCTHFTKARSEGAKAWEGSGLESRFIRILVAGYDKAKSGTIDLLKHQEIAGQLSFF